MKAPPSLSSAEKKHLRGKAMALKPSLVIGRDGPSEKNLEAARTALGRDSLIKIRIEAPDRQTRKSWLAEVVSACGATLCGEVGHTASLFRPRAPSTENPERPTD